ncbi:lysine--tRNA ligase [Candidatus Peregrinibacteria bacterium]|nr:lysine--tRNA ligase [Candidatus Peregrinibacteria bacterium]
MTWIDRAVGDIEQRFAKEMKEGKPLIIRDEKTLSGRVHVGSLRGIAIHGIIAQALSEKGIKNKFLFELNDFDPMDEMPPFLDKNVYKKHMGEPLFTVPAHEDGAENFPMVFGKELQEVVKKFNFPIEFYALRPVYEAGRFNDAIRAALDHHDEIRAIYREVSGSKKPDDWYPLQVICEQCGKIGTTQVNGWNPSASSGQAGPPGMVSYVCKKDLVKWAEGCGKSGTVSPFDGRAKLPWKVEWPAKWKVMGVHIEGAGKDHSAAGGSRDIGKRIVEEVFNDPNPYDIPYEFFNIGGKKMSASKGLGATAKAISDLLPPKLLKLLMIRKLPNQPIDFDPEGNTIPLLFDEYDRLADYHFNRQKGGPNPEFARLYHLAQTDFPKKPKDIWHMRFSLVAFLVQMPHLSIEEEGAKLKGSALTKEELADVKERAVYVKIWLETYAPEKYKFEIFRGKNPYFAEKPLSDLQKKTLAALAVALEKVKWDGPKIHEAIHVVKEEQQIPPRDLFVPLYRMFLDRDEGPQVGWFLSTFKREEVIDQIQKHLSQP